jgi:endoglucanase Acf2
MDRTMEMLLDDVKEVHFEVKHRATLERREIWMLIMLEEEENTGTPQTFRMLRTENQKIIMDKIEEYIREHYFGYQFQRVTAVREIPDTEKKKIRMLYTA